MEILPYAPGALFYFLTVGGMPRTVKLALSHFGVQLGESKLLWKEN